jgi:diguanylate cyclase (GGDEF)-like protein/PAS domain S-box-containing protein
MPNFLKKRRVEEDRKMSLSRLYVDDNNKDCLTMDTFISILENHPHAIIFFDRKGRVIAFNEQAVSLFGGEPSSSFGEIIDKKSYHKSIRFFKSALKGQPQHFNTTLTTHDGATDTQVTAIPVMYGDKVCYVVGVMKEFRELNDIYTAIRRFNEDFSKIQEAAGFGFIEYDVEYDDMTCSHQVFEILGMKDEKEKRNFSFQRFLHYVHPNDRSTLQSKYKKLLETGESFSLTYRIIRSDGAERIISVQAIPQDFVKSKPTKIIGILIDLTEKIYLQKHLEELNYTIANITNQFNICIWAVDVQKNKVLFCSKAVEKIYGRDIDFFKKNPDYWKSCIHRDDLQNVLANQDSLIRGEILNQEYRIVHPDGKVVWVVDHSIPTLNEEGELVRIDGIIADITKMKENEMKLARLSSYDFLTNLPNQHSLMNDLTKWIDHYGKKGEMFAILFSDLDNFKVINNSLGRMAGDSVLKMIANRLEKIVIGKGNIYRLAGDEFVFLVSVGNNVELYIQFAQEIINTVEASLEVDDHEVCMTTSIGISFFPTDGQNRKALLTNAEIAMHRAKELGKNNYQIYSPTVSISAFKNFHLEKELRKALKNQELHIEYQPRIDAKTYHVNGAEALVRWKHPEWGAVSPYEFIPLAEAGELINEIGDWIIVQVCQQIKRWQKKNLNVNLISINISPKRFLKKDFYETLEKAISEANVQPSMLEIEITERSLLQSEELVHEQLRKIKQLGIRVALDDFGSGFTSLNNIREFPIDTLKIDKSFIQNLELERKDRVITKSIIEIARELNIKVVGEGVETKKQLSLLQNYQCDEIQGFLFSRSLSPAEMEDVFRKGKIFPVTMQQKQNIEFERRKYFRVELPHPILFNMTIAKFNNKQVHVGKTEALLINISADGLCFTTHLRLPMRDDIIYQFEVPIMEENVVLNGKIVWSKEIYANIFKYGVQLCDISDSDRDRLMSLLNKLNVYLVKKRTFEDKHMIKEDPIHYIKKRYL